MSKKIITVDGKTFVINEKGETEEVTPEEVKPEVKPEEVKPEVAPESDDVDKKIEEAAKSVVASLGLDKIMGKLEELTKKEQPEKKVSALLDLEVLMKKDVKDMTTKEKIVGFFQAMIQRNDAVMKALSEGTAADGGYLFPDEFRAEIIRDLEEGGYMRSEVTVVPMKRDIMKIPTLSTRPKVTWTSENATKSTTTAAFDEATLTVYKMASIMYASDELVEDSTEIDVVQFIVSLFAESIGQEEDRVIWQGSGSGQPTGIYTAFNSGTIGGVDAAAAFTTDNLLDLVNALPNKYHRGAKLFAHKNAINRIRKFKDSNNMPIFQMPGANLQMTCLGFPLVEANELPEKCVVFGDLKKTYWLGDRKRMTVKVTQDTETALKSEGSIKGMNCWETLGLLVNPRIISSQTMLAIA